MSRNRICRMPVDKDFRQMFKLRATSEGKSMLQLSREEAQRMRSQYSGPQNAHKSLFFK